MELCWESKHPKRQCATFASATIIFLGLLLYLDRYEFRSKSKLLALCGILCTTSAWVSLEKLVEVYQPHDKGQLQVYIILAVTNVLIAISYERYYNVDIFSKLNEI